VRTVAGPLIVVVCSMGIAGCGRFVRTSHHTIFSVTGRVETTNGTPLSNAEITLELSRPVYDGITPVTSAQTKSDEHGGFRFVFIAHGQNIAYRLVCRQPGFNADTKFGKSPPAEHHICKLAASASSVCGQESPDVSSEGK
jgi:hypothetical protein